MKIFFVFAAVCCCSLSHLSAQNVGIGTTSPTTTLDVNGQIRMRGGTPGAGKVLASDANGVASWQIVGTLLQPPLILSSADYSYVASFTNLGASGAAVYAVGGASSGYAAFPSAIFASSADQIGVSSFSLTNSAADLRNFSTSAPTILVWNQNATTANPTAASFFGSVLVRKPSGALSGGASSGNVTIEGVLGVGTAANTSTNIQMNNTIGNKIALFGNASGQHYGLGMATNMMLMFTDQASHDLAFGYGSGASFTETIRFTGDGKVGIGTTIPDRSLEIIAASGTSVATIGSRSAFGSGAVEFVSDYGLASQWRPGFIQSEDFGNFTGKLVLYTNGTTSANKYGAVKGLEIRNGAVYTATGTVSSFSDERLKENVVPFTDGLNVVTQINPVQFQYNDAAPFATHDQQVGVVAQQLEKIAPYMVQQASLPNLPDLRSINNQAYVFLLINAVKELQQQNLALQHRIEALEHKK